MSTIGDQPLEEFVLERKSAASGREAGAELTVFVDEGGLPVSAVPPGTVMSPGQHSPPIIVADAGLDLELALGSPAFEEFPTVNAVVVVDEDRIVGVWGGPSLARAVALGSTRSMTGRLDGVWGRAANVLGPILPGVPKIPSIVRSCRFVEQGRICATVATFVRRPPNLAWCDNDQGMSPHRFMW